MDRAASIRGRDPGVDPHGDLQVSLPGKQDIRDTLNDSIQIFENPFEYASGEAEIADLAESVSLESLRIPVLGSLPIRYQNPTEIDDPVGLQIDGMCSRTFPFGIR